MKLRTLRQRRRWTQEDLELISKVPQNTISRMENGLVVRPTLAVMLALAKAFDVDPMAIEFGLAPSQRKPKPKAKAKADLLARRRRALSTSAADGVR